MALNISRAGDNTATADGAVEEAVAAVEEADTPGAGTVSGHHTAPRQHEEETLMTLWNNHMQGTNGPGVLHMDHIRDDSKIT